MMEACATTCTEFVFRDQMQLRLSRNEFDGYRHFRDLFHAGLGLLLAAGVEAAWRWLISSDARVPPSSALPCLLVTSYFLIDGLCSIQQRIHYWAWLNPNWRKVRHMADR